MPRSFRGGAEIICGGVSLDSRSRSNLGAFPVLAGPVAGCEWIRPIILDEDDRLTTGTKRVVLAHNRRGQNFADRMIWAKFAGFGLMAGNSRP